MNRRQFIGTFGANLVVAGAGEAVFLGAPRRRPQVAITLDDPDVDVAPLLSPDERNRRILAALRKHSNLKAALFVCGKRIDSDAGRTLLNLWSRDGHVIGNHSYSHSYYHSSKITFERYSEDILRAEELLKEYPNFEKIMRFPYLKEGDTPAKRDEMRAFLKAHGYRMGYATIDTSEWYVDERLSKRLEREPNADLAPYRKFFLNHIWERTLYYDGLAKKVVGHPVRHTLLIHHSLVAALFLDDLLQMFQRRGWGLIDARQAFADPIFSRLPNVLPAGESLIWMLAKERGKFDELLRYPGEDGEYERAKMDALGL